MEGGCDFRRIGQIVSPLKVAIKLQAFISQVVKKEVFGISKMFFSGQLNDLFEQSSVFKAVFHAEEACACSFLGEVR